jgi:hypothetical protein
MRASSHPHAARALLAVVSKPDTSMAPAPDDVASLLYGLESRLPSMLAEAPTRDAFWQMFRQHAQDVRDAGGAERHAYVETELQRMLASHGLIPSPFDGPIDPIDDTKDQ